MTGLRELFEDAADAPPPSRLLADEVYAAGRRRLRHRRTAVGGTALAVTACVLAVAAVASTSGIGPEPVPDDRAATAGPPTSPGVLPQSGRIQMIWAADARHIYLGLSTCPGSGPCKARWQLVGSDDGGQTWTERGTPGQFASTLVLGPDVLLADIPPEQPGTGPTELMASRDGGRSWQATRTGVPVPALAPGNSAVCRPDPDAGTGGVREREGEPCRVYAFDPVSNQVSPLTRQPAQTLVERQRIEESAGRLWAPGFDRETGQPAVATSADGGRTWSSQVFADGPSCGVDGCPLPSVAVGSGPVGYAVLNGVGARAVYRHTPGEGWQRVAAADQIPYGPEYTDSFVTPDGGHLLYQYAQNRDGSEAGRFWLARRGEDSYRPVELDGLPAMSSGFSRAGDGWLYVRGDGDVGYGSTDGLHWAPLNRR